jgi:hypothetical protein
MTDEKTITLVAVGDVMPRRENAEELFDFTRSIFKEADITMGQLERPISERSRLYRTSGDINPRRLAKVLADAGFNLFTFASNHTMDAGDDGVSETIDLLNENNIKVIGAGKDIHCAREPAIFELKGTKIGFLDYCSVMAPGHEADEYRTGACPMRVSTAYQVSTVQPGNPPQHIITKTNGGDLASMVKDIQKLRSKVDVLVVSQHWGIHFVTSPIADYEYEVGHAAIDAGADIIIGTHAHTLKGIEVYKGKVILHCLGNFAFDHILAGRTAIGGGMTHDSHNYSLGPLGRGGWKIDPEYPTHAFPIDCLKSILLKCYISDKRIQRVAFIPCFLTKKGQPQPLPPSDPRNEEIFHYMEWLCEDQRIYDTKFSREGDEIVVWT